MGRPCLGFRLRGWRVSRTIVLNMEHLQATRAKIACIPMRSKIPHESSLANDSETASASAPCALDRGFAHLFSHSSCSRRSGGADAGGGSDCLRHQRIAACLWIGCSAGHAICSLLEWRAAWRPGAFCPLQHAGNAADCVTVSLHCLLYTSP